MLQYDEISLTFTAGYVCLCCVCSPVVVLGLSVRVSWYPMSWVRCGCCSDCDACTVVCVACVFAARLLVCQDDGSAGVGFGGGVVAVSAYMGGTRGSGVLASAVDVLEISVVRAVGGVYGMGMCLARGGVGGVGGEWVTGLVLGFTNYGGTWGSGVCVLVAVVWVVLGRVGGRLGPGSGRVG